MWGDGSEHRQLGHSLTPSLVWTRERAAHPRDAEQSQGCDGITGPSVARCSHTSGHLRRTGLHCGSFSWRHWGSCPVSRGKMECGVLELQRLGSLEGQHGAET